jgi:phenylpropionate dioxygenase-like ring-hydroxylating dioxygenase large terminal subunit
MLSKEENELLTRVGPGTPMGNLFRRFWLPAMISSEVPEPDSPPVRLRLLGEDLVGFRATDGSVGIIEPYCPHKLAHLFWGRNEEQGLRCVYHGWKFDAKGNCVDMPNEPTDSSFKEKVKLNSYSTREAGGVVWVYMGPKDKMPPELPQMEWVRAPEGYQVVTKWLQRTNWAQGMEGEIDTSHISFLHGGRGPQWEPDYPGTIRVTGGIGRLDPKRARAQTDGSPILTLRETPYGFTYGARRNAGDGDYYWRVTRWLYPFYSLIAGGNTGGRCWVPIDDHHTWTFGYQCRDDRPYTQEEVDYIWEGRTFPPRVTRGTFTLPDGYVIDSWLPVANKENDYLIDRTIQKYGNFSGIWGLNEQDRSIQESMRPIVDRSREHLGRSDVAAIAARRLLIRMARNLQTGIEPECLRNVDAYRVRAIDIVAPIDDFDKLLEAHHQDLGIAVL